MVLVIAFRFVQGEVQVDVFHVGQRGFSRGVRFTRFGRGLGIAFRPIVMLVPFQNAGFVSVVIRTAEIVVIVTTRVIQRRERVVLHPGHRSGFQLIPKIVQVTDRGGPGFLLRCAQTIQSHVLRIAHPRGIVKGIGGGSLA